MSKYKNSFRWCPSCKKLTDMPATGKHRYNRHESIPNGDELVPYYVTQRKCTVCKRTFDFKDISGIALSGLTAQIQTKRIQLKTMEGNVNMLDSILKSTQSRNKLLQDRIYKMREMVLDVDHLKAKIIAISNV